MIPLLTVAAVSAVLSTTTPDGLLVVPVPPGWSANLSQEPGGLAFQGPGGYFSLTPRTEDRGFMYQRVNVESDAYLKAANEAGKSCKGGPVQLTQMANGKQLAYRQIDCQGVKNPIFYGAFTLGEFVYPVRWHMEVGDPFKYGLGIVTLIQKATGGPVENWILSPDGDVMIPFPPGGWEDHTPEARAKQPNAIAELKIGNNFLTILHEYWQGPQGLAALAAGEAENRAASLGRCRAAGSGQTKLQNGWSMAGYALDCETTEGRKIYSFGAFSVKNRAYAVFGAYDKRDLDATLGSAMTVDEAQRKAELAAKPVAIEAEGSHMPPFVLWIGLAAVPFVLSIFYLLFRRRKAPEPEPEPESESEDESSPGP